jgi:hypothetical protein
MKSATTLLSACLVTLLGVLPGPAAAAAAVASEQRPVADFRRVVMRAAGELIVHQGQREALRIEAEPRLLPVIASEVRDGTLYLEFRASQVNTLYPVRFHLTVTALEAVASQASADLRMGPLKSRTFDLELTGSGNVDIEALDATRSRTRITGSSNVAIGGGRVDAQTIEIDGSGDYAAAPLASRSTQVTIGGSGNVEVAAGERLSVDISGSGEVRYHGNPRVDEHISGAGSVRRVD